MTQVKAKTKQYRGFAVMEPALRQEIARRGGAAVKAEDRSFSRNKTLAAEAGRKGGSSRKKKSNI